MQDTEASTIYHYTNINAFMSILQTRQLWATHISGMSDTSERLDFIRRFKQALNSTTFEHESVQRQIIDFVHFVETGHFGVLSFCKKRDEPSQWEIYANEGKGFALGFKKNNLKEILKRRKTGMSIILRDLGTIFINETIYDESDKKSIIEDLLERFRNMPPQTARIDTRFLSARDEIVKQACSFKDASFSGEHEVRLVKWFREYHQKDTTLYGEEYMRENYAHREVSGVPRLYYKHDFLPEWIDEILLGPNCTAKEQEIQQYLSELGYPLSQIKISRSTSPPF